MRKYAIIKPTIALALLIASIGAALAQSGTPLPVVPGSNSITGCPSPNLTPCFVPNSAASPVFVNQTTPAAGSGNAGSPLGSTPVTSSATGTTGAVVATLPAVAAKFTYICGFTATGNEAATGGIFAVTVAGTVSGSLNFNISHPVTPTLGVLSITLTPCVPSSAVNTAITVTSAADAAGANVAVSAWGYQQ